MRAKGESIIAISHPEYFSGGVKKSAKLFIAPTVEYNFLGVFHVVKITSLLWFERNCDPRKQARCKNRVE